MAGWRRVTDRPAAVEGWQAALCRLRQPWTDGNGQLIARSRHQPPRTRNIDRRFAGFDRKRCALPYSRFTVLDPVRRQPQSLITFETRSMHGAFQRHAGPARVKSLTATSTMMPSAGSSILGFTFLSAFLKMLRSGSLSNRAVTPSCSTDFMRLIPSTANCPQAPRRGW